MRGAILGPAVCLDLDERRDPPPARPLAHEEGAEQAPRRLDGGSGEQAAKTGRLAQRYRSLRAVGVIQPKSRKKAGMSEAR